METNYSKVAKQINMQQLSDFICRRTEQTLCKELAYARSTHPEFSPEPKDALPIILEELGEVAKSINEGDSIEHLCQEVAQTAITCIRFLEHNSGVVPSQSVFPFIDDEEKIADMLILSKDEFLKSYSYVSEADYDATLVQLKRKLKMKGR